MHHRPRDGLPARSARSRRAAHRLRAPHGRPEGTEPETVREARPLPGNGAGLIAGERQSLVRLMT